MKNSKNIAKSFEKVLCYLSFVFFCNAFQEICSCSESDFKFHFQKKSFFIQKLNAKQYSSATLFPLCYRIYPQLVSLFGIYQSPFPEFSC